MADAGASHIVRTRGRRRGSCFQSNKPGCGAPNRLPIPSHSVTSYEKQLEASLELVAHAMVTGGRLARLLALLLVAGALGRAATAQSGEARGYPRTASGALVPRAGPPTGPPASRQHLRRARWSGGTGTGSRPAGRPL